MTEQNFNLPDGWKWAELESICVFSNGLWKGKNGKLLPIKIVRNTNFTETGLLDYSDVAEIEVESKQLEQRILSYGDIILERSGGGPTQPVGRVAFFDKTTDDYSFSNFTTRIRIKDKEQLYAQYLWYALHNFYASGITEFLQRRTHGIRNLEFKKYKKLLVPLPPFSEQKRIIKILNEQMAAVEKARKLAEEQLQAAKTLPAAYLREVFESEKAKNWQLIKLGEICNLYQPETISMQQMTAQPGQFKVFGANGVIGSYAKYNHEDSEVLITCRGATCGSVNISEPKCWITGNSMVVKPYDTSIRDKIFLYWALKITDFTKAIAGAAQPQITRRSLSPVEIPLPPLSEQKRIVKILNEQMTAVEKARKEAEEQLSIIEVMPSALLRKAFMGEL